MVEGMESPADLAPLKARLLHARSTLVEASPFLGSLVLGLPVAIVEGPGLATAAVDSHGRCHFAKDFLARLSLPEVRAVLLHEVLHLALEAFHRRGRREPRRWNVAHDLAVNHLIDESGLARGFLAWSEDFPPLRDPAYARLSAEEIFERLPQDLSELGVFVEDLRALEWDDLSPEARESLRQAWREKLVRAAEQAMAAGGIDSLPGWARKLLGSLLAPQVPWEVQLAQRVHGHLRGRRRTYARPGRRSQAVGAVLPGPRRDRGAVGVFVDVSGSVLPGELAAFMGELTGVLDAADLPVRLITWDAGVQEDLWLERAESLHEALATGTCTLTGGGGTDPRCVIRHLSGPGENGDLPLPDFGLLLTDGCVPWPGAGDWPLDLLVVTTRQPPPAALGYESLQILSGVPE